MGIQFIFFIWLAIETILLIIPTIERLIKKLKEVLDSFKTNE